MDGSNIKKRILVLNQGLSGVNKYIFSELEKRNWELFFIEVPFPKKCIVQALVSSFKPSFSNWKNSAKERLSQLHKSSKIFIQRTEFCQKRIEELHGNFELIFQISGMFAPTLDFKNLNYPYVTFNDYTMVLCKKYPRWASSSSEMDKWLDLEKKLYEHADFIFTCSENTRNSFIKDYGISSGKVISLNYGVSSNNIVDFEKSYDGRTIIFVGKDFERKGGYVLLDAFKKVRDEIKDAKLVIVGAFKNPSIIKQPGVDMLGYVQDKNELIDLYRKASIFVMPSLCEPFGMVFLEAMIYKLPCIGTNIDAMPEIIENGKTGFLVPPNNSEILADKIITLLKNPDLSAEMGSNGFDRVNKKFRWEDLGDKIDRYLKKCIGSND